MDKGTPGRRALFLFLMLLAAVQCSRSALFVNVSYLDLSRYAHGAERLPYQRRIGMVPVLWAAEHSPLFVRVAASIDRAQKATPQHASTPETMSADKLACEVVGAISACLMTLAGIFYTTRRYPALWWLGGVLVLGILYASYAARAELNLWYPYDLPHFAIFGLATLCLLEGAWVPFFLLFCLDVPLRETSCFLLLAAAAVAWSRQQRGVIVGLAAAGLLYFVPVQLAISHHFAHNPTEVGVRWHKDLMAVLLPLHWPQVASACGYLVVPLWLSRRYLSADRRALLLAMVPCFVFTLVFGMWYESRIFGEWTVAVALLSCDCLAAYLGQAERGFAPQGHTETTLQAG